MSYDGLLNSRVAVSRLQLITDDGRAQMVWIDEPTLTYVPCRLDLTFLRPGKDVPMPVEAGKAPDRSGICFARIDSGLKAGDRLTAVPNDSGQLPVTGIFDIRVIPDQVLGFSNAHHQEIFVVEVSQDFSDAVRPFPGGPN